MTVICARWREPMRTDASRIQYLVVKIDYASLCLSGKVAVEETLVRFGVVLGSCVIEWISV